MIRESTNGDEPDRTMLTPTVTIIDPNPAMADAIRHLTECRGIDVSHFDAAEDYLEKTQLDEPGCVVAAAELPGIGGIELLERLRTTDILPPVIIVSTSAEIAMAVRAMKAGALDFLAKPCRPADLWKAIQQGIESDRLARQREAVRRRIRCRLDRMTAEEKQVMRMVLQGDSNKIIAHQMRLSVRTIDFRRASILRKMEARSLIELAQMLTVVSQSLQSPWNSITVAGIAATHAAG